MTETKSVSAMLPLEDYNKLISFGKKIDTTNVSQLVRDALAAYMKNNDPDMMSNDQMLRAVYDQVSAMNLGTSKMTGTKGNRVMIFLDVRNVTSFDKTAKIHFSMMVENLVKGRELMAAYAYDSVMYGSDGVDTSIRFHDYLRNNGFDLKLRDTTQETVQKEVDVALAVDMVQHAYDDNYDTAILISGDRDFVPAVEKVKAKGKRVEVASFGGSMSHVLQKKANFKYELDNMYIIQLMDPETAKKYEHKEEVAE